VKTLNYKLLSISNENLLREQSAIYLISECIRNRESWYFDAGAGAGKTFTLIQTLKYIVGQNSKMLKKHNQKILCITYTNVAANEIKERLGSTSLVDVSTIHDCVWRIISSYQEQLVEIHEKKLFEEIDQLTDALNAERWSENYRILSGEEQANLLRIIHERKTDYYKHKGDGAAAFREVFSEVALMFPNILSNVENFKKIVNSLLKISKFQDACTKIQEKNNRFIKVRYDARFNNDKLEKMRISHETLLEYTLKIISENKLLKQIICDKYPIVLVDEYQDTSPLVVESLSLIDEYARSIGHSFIVGYYGDVKQNIYESGVGIRFKNIHTNLKRIEKTFNRRSSPQIISIANKIRNDGLYQETIYNEFPIGEVSFYNMNVDRQEFINSYISKWNINKDNKLHCLELTNEKVAEQSGFIEFYNFFKYTKWYKLGRNFNFLREHILSSDENKLGNIQKILFKLLDFKTKINNDLTMIMNVFGKNHLKGANITELRHLVSILQSITGNTLEEYITNIFSMYNNGNCRYDLCIDYVIAEEIKSLDNLKQFILNQLYYFSEEQEDSADDSAKYEKEVSEFLKIDMKIFDLWYSFVTNTCKGEVNYHTYHGTKGSEYDNVIIFMNSKFGRKDNYFKNLLTILAEKNEINEIGTDLESARNLLYVAVTRATKNLCIVYFDDLTYINSSVKDVFGEIKYTL
jgi:DNA helicase-2/ATP-dependent DNA helicase PcrA